MFYKGRVSIDRKPNSNQIKSDNKLRKINGGFTFFGIQDLDHRHILFTIGIRKCFT